MAEHPDKRGAADPSARAAIYLSALAWPGAGQFIQKRWPAGLFYAALFSVCAVFLTIAIFAPLFWNLRMMAEYSGKAESMVFRPILFAKIMFWLGLSALVYLASLLDAFLCYKRRQKQGKHADN